MTFPTSRFSDQGSHRGIVITGSGTRMVNGLPVARISDTYLCAIHGPQPIVQVTGGPICEALPVAHIGAIAQCGASIITGSGDTYQGLGSGGSGAAAAERDQIALSDTPDTDPAVGGGGGGSLYQRGRQRALFGDEPGAPTAQNDATPPPTEETPTDCSAITEQNVSDSFQLSPNFTLGALSSQAALSRNRVIAQSGLTVSQIVCNLKSLSENVCEPLRTRYGSFVITSGFRSGNGQSQHGTGQAVDVQFPGVTFDTVWERAQWVKDNIPYDQFILEYLTVGTGGRPWFHLSFSRTGNRRQVLTCKYPGRYEPGLKRYH